MNSPTMKKPFCHLLVSALSVIVLQGCAVGPNVNPADPLEPLNRTVFNFNDGVDRAILKPVATVYRDVTPSPIRTGISNFFGNLSDVVALLNNVLQLKPKESAETLMRLSFNTIFGFGGVFDIATEMRLEKHPGDFGQTLGHWGVGTGPYLVLPLLGSSTVRDSLGAVVDTQADPLFHYKDVPARNSLTVLDVVDTRSGFLGAGELLDQASLDKYSFTRDIYLQRRRGLINPDKAEKEERFDLPEGATPSTTPSAPPAGAAKDPK